MPFLLIANLLSFVSASFTAASSWTKDPHRTYWYMVGQCLVYAAASYFFGVYASIPLMLVCALRNYLVAARKYSFRWMALCSAVSLVVGLLVNQGSIPGYLSIFMTVYYTVSSFYLTGAKAVKLNYAFDMFLWFLYDLLVFDVPSGIMDFSGTVLGLVTFFRIRWDEQRSRKA